jgi:hypothetical protein
MAGPPDAPLSPRRFLAEAARRLLDVAEKAVPPPPEDVPFLPPRLTFRAPTTETRRMSRLRTSIMENLDEMYREAFDRAKASADQAQMTTLDFAYRREQLYFEILLDIRDAMERRG